ncbi:mariner Mos1 transposase [Trichonephila clavipes]|nr:mariner Mos1 transposase [Trichonephila clavipes]
MASQIPEEIHIHHCMLLEFHKGSNATVATKIICDVYPSALEVQKCQSWFSKFRSGNFDLSDSHRSRRPTTLDNDVIKIASGRQSRNFQMLSTNLGRPPKNICNRVGVWVPHNLTEENRANPSTTCNLLLQWYNTEPFFDRLITADEKWVMYDNPKDSGSLRMKRHKGLLSQVYIQKRRFCVFGRVFVESSILKCLNLEKLLMQTFIVNN